MKKKSSLILVLMIATANITACSSNNNEASMPSLNPNQKEATEFTKEANKVYYSMLNFDDETEKENATKGLIAAPKSLEIRDENGKLVWSQDAYEFLEDNDPPNTVNPSLWKNAQLNHIYGLFEVTEGIYQVRGYDMTNITFIRGDSGWIVFDPLMSVECARAATELVYENIEKLPITGVLYSHPHIDHYGGVSGVITQEEATKRNVPIIAPEGFEESATSENIYAGPAMKRRASYQYGNYLERDEKGEVAIGIGQGQSFGTLSYINPTHIIKKTGEKLTVDGVEMEFQMTPGTEAPAEMNIWFPEKKALWMAENCTGTLHNLYTLRGAEVRDGNAWAKYIMETVSLYGKEAEVVFQSHNWPHFGNEQIVNYLIDTASIYKFINDQTLLYINQGYTSEEIADMIKLPEELEKVWYTRQYYGTLKHNVKAVYQKYMGWYDANPVNLDKLPKSESAAKFVEYMGGDADKIIEMAKKDFENGEYQWVAEITNILVYNDPENLDARYLCADALEQLAYSAESGTWRNAYLTAALELRNGIDIDTTNTTASDGSQLKQMTAEMCLDYLGIVFDSNKKQDLNCKVNLNFTNDENYLMTIKSGIILYQKGVSDENADITLTLSTAQTLILTSKDKDVIQKNIKVEGDTELLNYIIDGFTAFDRNFNIIEP